MSDNLATIFRRRHLHNSLRAAELLRSVEVQNGSLVTKSASWEEYWSSVPPAFDSFVEHLKESWLAYIQSDCAPSLVRPYVIAYFTLLNALAKGRNEQLDPETGFARRVLGFENFVLKFGGTGEPFAAATTSFRNPVFLSFQSRGIRKHDRNDPSFLVLVVAVHNEKAGVFFHYRRLLLPERTNRSVLFFRAVDAGRRIGSFQGLGAIEGKLGPAWGTRVAERSRLLGDKVISPILTQLDQRTRAKTARPTRILDIGSGSGLFTSKLIARLARTGALGHGKVDLTLLDIYPVEPRRHFRGPQFISRIDKLEYFSQDYRTWIVQRDLRRNLRYDIVLICRILHNLSRFRIGRVAADPQGAAIRRGRYIAYPHMSDYYCLVSAVMGKDEGADPCLGSEPGLFHPFRGLDPNVLLTADGQSIIESLLEMANGVVIEDGDAASDDLIDHLKAHAREGTRAYDLSKALRLSINHVYWLTGRGGVEPPLGELIWPQ